MDYQYREGWVFLKEASGADGVKVSVSVGQGTLMDDGNYKRRAKYTLDTLGPFPSSEAAVAAGKQLAEQWIDARGGVVR